MKDLKINAPKGYEIDKDKSTFENIVFKEISKLPSSFKELENVSGYYISPESDVIFGRTYQGISFEKRIFKTKKQAEASIALAQLSQLRDVYRQGWEPDWGNYGNKHCIYFHSSSVFKRQITLTNHFLSFQDEKTAELFLENFIDLIEKAKPLMS
jgi:hypothetical protein